MDSEFHYYITGIIAHRAGFTKEESTIIAHASQLVDDNAIIYNVKDKETNEIYSNYISQTINILKPRKTLMRIYSVFHFVPGDPMAVSARRKDGKMHILNTTPNSELSQNLMYKAFTSLENNYLYRIGIATHSYVDTWAHQNFIGLNDVMNNVGMNLIPNIGHSDVFLDPDRVNRNWVDSRLLDSEINNNIRFIAAAEKLFHLYTEYLGSNKVWSIVRNVLVKIMNYPEQSDRLDAYHKIIPWLPRYHDYKWFSESIEQKVVGLKDSANELLSQFTVFKDEYWWRNGIKKENTDWFKFQEAIKEHQIVALTAINSMCKYMEIDAPLF